MLLAIAFVLAIFPAEPALAAPGEPPYGRPSRVNPNAMLEPPHAPVHGQPTLPVATRAGEILVKVKTGVAIQAVIARYGLKGPASRYIDLADTPANQKTGALRWFRVPVVEGTEGAAVVALARLPSLVEYVQLIPQFVGSPAGTPNDQCYTQPSVCGTAQQPYMDFIKMPRGWDRTHASSTAPSTAIAVVDTGLQANHPDIQGKDLTGWDYTNGLPGTAIAAGTGTDSYNCFTGHGTGVSSIAAAKTDNVSGMAGTGWDAKIIPIKWLRSSDCQPDANVSLAATLYKARDLGAKVVNLSVWTGSIYMQADQDAINNLTLTYGILVVAAAGNNNCLLATGATAYPCAYASVLCVGGSHTADSGRWSVNGTCTINADNRFGSNYGGQYVHVSAPAVSVVNATANSSYAASPGGTSYAAPLVSGIAALLMASGCRPLEARQAIFDSAQGNDGWTKYGPVNAAGALTRRCAPASTAFRDGTRIDIFALGKDGNIHQLVWTAGGGWQNWDQGGFPVGRPAVGAGSSPYAIWSQFDGLGSGHRLDVWVEGIDNTLYQMIYCDSQGLVCPGVGWSTWYQMTGITAASTPAFAGKRTNVATALRYDLFTRGFNESIFYERPWTQATGFTPWTSAPGGPAVGAKSEPSSVWWGSSDNLLDLLSLGDDGRLYHNFLASSDPSAPVWAGWADRGISQGGLLTTSPYSTASPSTTINRLDTLALAANGLIYQLAYVNGIWTWGPTGAGQLAAGSGPTATWRGTTRIEAFFIAYDGNIYTSSYLADQPTPTWTNWSIVIGVP